MQSSALKGEMVLGAQRGVTGSISEANGESKADYEDEDKEQEAMLSLHC